MLVHNKKNYCSKKHASFKLFMDNIEISRTNKYKYLGIWVDELLKWDCHINEVCTKLSQCCGILYKTRKNLTTKTKMMVYYLLVQQKLQYGFLIWESASSKLLNKL